MAGAGKSWIRMTVLMAVIALLRLGAAGSAGATVWHVCMHCKDRTVQSIGDALKRAEPRDTIVVYWEPEFPYYMEHLVIDKPLRIISSVAAADITDYDLYPVITATEREIIHVTVPGVEIIGFNIMYLQKPDECGDPAECYDDSVGIRLDAPAMIRQCAITNCATGILAAYRSGVPAQGSMILQCRIGLPADHGINPADLKQVSNHFGLVLLGSRISGPDLGRGGDIIRDCQIVRNTQYGVVYTSSNAPVLEGNLLDFNTLGPYRIARPELDSRQHLVWVPIPALSDGAAP